MTTVEIHNINIYPSNTFSSDILDMKFTENLQLYPDINKNEQLLSTVHPIDKDDSVEQRRMSMIVRGRKSSIQSNDPMSDWNAIDPIYRMPGQIISDLLTSSSFAFCDTYEEFAFFTEGRHIIAVKNIPPDQFDQARKGLLLKNVTRLTSIPASSDTFKAAKASASKSVIKPNKLYVIDTKRNNKSEFVMISEKYEHQMFLPNKEEVAVIKKRLAIRIDQRKREAELGTEAKKVAQAKDEQLRAKQEAWAATICIHCAVSKGKHDYCRTCRRVTCKTEFIKCRRCSKPISCVRCIERRSVRGRSGAFYCNRKEAEVAESTSFQRYAPRR